MVQFFHIRGIDLDSEVQEFVQGTDLVKMLKQVETNYEYIQTFMLITCLFVLVAYSVAIPK
jgi:hypothetical protein